MGPSTRNSVDRFIGGRVRMARTGLKMTSKEIATHLELTEQEIADFEAGNLRINASLLFTLSKLLKVPISYFFDGLSDQDTSIKDQLIPDK